MHIRGHESQLNLKLYTFAAFFMMFVLSSFAVVSSRLVLSEKLPTGQFTDGFRAGFMASALSRTLINVVLFGVVAAVRRTKWTLIGTVILILLAGVQLCTFFGMLSWDEAVRAILPSMTRLLVFNKTSWTLYAFTAVVFYQMWRVRSLQNQEEEGRQRILDFEAAASESGGRPRDF